MVLEADLAIVSDWSLALIGNASGGKPLVNPDVDPRHFR
jgi:hypothetical protein